MAYLSWRRDFEIGVGHIDAEHRKLFRLINEFHDAHVHANSARDSAAALNRLIAYAEEHFQHEEKLMGEGAAADLARELEGS